MHAADPVRADHHIGAAVAQILPESVPLGDRFVATHSSSTRSLSATDLAERAGRYFAEVEAVDDPVEALVRARATGEPLLVTGSLYLLADLAKDESVRWRTLATS